VLFNERTYLRVMEARNEIDLKENEIHDLKLS
jgi:hypothetical protein